jgi:hypothetical protein
MITRKIAGDLFNRLGSPVAEIVPNTQPAFARDPMQDCLAVAPSFQPKRKRSALRSTSSPVLAARSSNGTSHQLPRHDEELLHSPCPLSWLIYTSLGADDPSLPARCAVTRLVLKSAGDADIFQ